MRGSGGGGGIWDWGFGISDSFSGRRYGDVSGDLFSGRRYGDMSLNIKKPSDRAASGLGFVGRCRLEALGPYLPNGNIHAEADAAGYRADDGD